MATILRFSPLLLSPRVAHFACFRLKSRRLLRTTTPLSSTIISSSASFLQPSTSPATPLPPTPPSAATAESLVSDSRKEASETSTLQWVSRTAYCGELRADDVGRQVLLCGWVAFHRVHGGLTFFNLRDASGIIQVTTIPDEFPDAYNAANKLRLEYVVAVEGTVKARPPESMNKKMKTGAIELSAEHVTVLNSVNCALPFPVTTAEDVKDIITEEIRLRFRFLDLRRAQMQSNLRLRHNVVKAIRRYLEDKLGFVELLSPPPPPLLMPLLLTLLSYRLRRWFAADLTPLRT